MSLIGNVKTAIQTKLTTLVPTYLQDVVVADIKQDPLDMELQAYPVAFIMPPAISTVELYDTNNVLRELTFTVMVIEKMENVQSTNQVEDLMEVMMNTIDSSITFSGAAVGGVQPSSSFPEPFIHKGQSLVVFDIIIKAKTLTTLTYS